MKTLLLTLITITLLDFSLAQSVDSPVSIGRLIINTSAGEYLLKGEVDKKGNHYYTLEKNDPNDPSSYNFTLFPYTPMGFCMQLSSVSKHYKDSELTKKLEEDALKYFHSFAMGLYVKNESELGPEAMRMKFRKQITVRKIPLKNQSIIKSKQVLNYLNNNNLLDRVDLNGSRKQVKNLQLALNDASLNKNLQPILENNRLTIPERNQLLIEKAQDHLINQAQGTLQEMQSNIIKLTDEYITIEAQSNLFDDSLRSLMNTYRSINDLIDSQRKNQQELNNKFSSENLSIELEPLQKEHNKLESSYRQWSEVREKLEDILSSTEELDTLVDSTSVSFKPLLNFLIDEKIVDTDIDTVTVIDTIVKEKINQKIDELDKQRKTLLTRIQEYTIAQKTYSQIESEIIKHMKAKVDFENVIKQLKDQNLTRRTELLEKDKERNEAINSYNQHLERIGSYDLEISEISMEINRGYIENIIVSGTKTINGQDTPIRSEFLKFINDAPIGISAKRDIEILHAVKLYARANSLDHYEIQLGNILYNIEEILAVDRKDYSPMSQAFRINLNSISEVTLYKETDKKVMDIKVYSDFIGIQEESPNGLVQLELNKEIPLVTTRVTKPELPGIFRWVVNRKWNMGYFNFIRPELAFSKIEGDNRVYSLTYVGNETKPFASALGLREHERVSIGTDLNLLFMDMPHAKSTFYLNQGFRFGMTEVALSSTSPPDNVQTAFMSNSFQILPEIGWKINGDERYGFDASFGVNWYFGDSKGGYEQVAEIPDNVDEITHNKKLLRASVMAYFNFNQENKGRVFVRFRSFKQLNSWKNNFSQLQVGYSTYLLSYIKDK